MNRLFSTLLWVCLSPCIDCLVLLYLVHCIHGRYLHLGIFKLNQPGVSDGSISLVQVMDEISVACNTTNETLAGTSQWAFSAVMIVVYLVIFACLIILLSLVIAAKAVRATIRFVLGNILVAAIMICFGTGLICLSTLVSNKHLISRKDDSAKLAVKTFLAVVTIGGSARSAFLLVFAVVVVVIIKCSNSAVNFKCLVISAIVVWIACGAVALLLLIPGVIEFDSFSCTIDVFLRAGPQLWIFAVLYFPFFAILPFTLAAIMPVYALCYIRSNAVSEKAGSLKPMVKFALFLLIGNMLCFMGLSVAVAIALITQFTYVEEEVLLFLVRMYNVLLALSLVPTPILILVYFKPVRIQMRKCLLRICSRWCKRLMVMSKQDPLTEMMLVSTADEDTRNS